MIATRWLVAIAVGALGARTSVAQQVTVPAGTPIVIELKSPLEASRAGQRFAGVLAADILVDAMLTAAAGDTCSGAVVQTEGGALSLELTEVRRPQGSRRIAAGDPRHGADPEPSAGVVGFAGSLAGPSAATSQAGKPVLGENGRLALRGGDVIEFVLRDAWQVPLVEAISVFPQPAGAATTAAATSAVPNAWFKQAERNQKEVQRQQQQLMQQQQRAATAGGYGSRSSYGSRTAYGRGGYGRGNYDRGGYGRSGYGTAWAMPVVAPLRPMTLDQRATAGLSPATLPAGTNVIARTSNPIDSSKVEPGATFDAILMTDLVGAGRVLIERGSKAVGVVTVGKVGADLVPTLALTQLQLGGTPIAIRTGAVRILHLPARITPPSAVGIGSAFDATTGAAPPADGALRLPDGTILEFGLADAVTLR